MHFDQQLVPYKLQIYLFENSFSTVISVANVEISIQPETMRSIKNRKVFGFVQLIIDVTSISLLAHD